jgi:hypothetical protein
MAVSRDKPELGSRNVRVKKNAARRRSYQKRKAVGLCAYFGCSQSAEVGRTLCHTHLKRMARESRKRIKTRKRQGLCIACGNRPQFWGLRCVICRAVSKQNVLPRGARRALRLYREAERKFEIEQTQIQTRFAVRKLLAAAEINGAHAKAFRLYTGLDRNILRTYAEVGKLMRISRERVRQLLYPSKVSLARMLDENIPWKPLPKN